MSSGKTADLIRYYIQRTRVYDSGQQTTIRPPLTKTLRGLFVSLVQCEELTKSRSDNTFAHVITYCVCVPFILFYAFRMEDRAHIVLFFLPVCLSETLMLLIISEW